MSWEVKKLEEVTERIKDGLHKTPEYTNDGIPFVSTTNLLPFRESFNFSSYKKYITEESYRELFKSNRPMKGDILISKCGTIGISQLVRTDLNFGIFVGLALVTPQKNVLDGEYLEYYLNSQVAQEKMNDLCTGTTRKTLALQALKKLDIIVPPLPTQKKIVEVLDSAFEKIAKAKENSEQNLKNAKEIFESYLQKVFENKGEDWEEKTLNEISENLDGKRKPITKKYREEGEIPYYGASGIVDYVKDFIFDEDLLLVSEDGANLLARTYPIAFSINGKTWVNNHAHVLRFESIFTQKFVERYLNSIKLDPYVSGMAQPKLNQKMLNKIPIHLPKSTEEQKEIVSKLDNLSNQTKKLENIYSQKLSSLEELKQSILQKAFKGELTEGLS